MLLAEHGSHSHLNPHWTERGREEQGGDLGSQESQSMWWPCWGWPRFLPMPSQGAFSRVPFRPACQGAGLTEGPGWDRGPGRHMRRGQAGDQAGTPLTGLTHISVKGPVGSFLGLYKLRGKTENMMWVLK